MAIIDTKRTRGHLYLFWISFASLFLELLLIRWVSSEIRIFAYFRNLILISCFIGLGIGFSIERYRPGLLFSLCLVLILSILVNPNARLFGVGFRDISMILDLSGYNIWGYGWDSGALMLALGYFMVTVVVVLLGGAFVPFGRILGDIFHHSDNRVRDYSINLLGALFGTWAFTAASYLYTPPLVWMLICGAVMIALLTPFSQKTIVGLGLLALILVLTMNRDPVGTTTYWSPYQKLQLIEKQQWTKDGTIHYKAIHINSSYYMDILDLSKAQFRRYPSVYSMKDGPYYPYDIPYRFHPAPKRVLVVGAGSGNDIAAALRNGARAVDAVEIDPMIARLASSENPEAPYQDPRVTVYIDDARSFFKKTHKRYDLIIFALLDSHTLTSNFTNINLDSYVYTLESLKEAKAILAKDGIISLSFLVLDRSSWIGQKFKLMIQKVFGETPLMIKNRKTNSVLGSGGTLFLFGDMDVIARSIKADPALAGIVKSKELPEDYFAGTAGDANEKLPSDDWPYLYLHDPDIPNLYYIMAAIMLALTIACVKYLLPGGRIGPAHFLFLGAGFMLVEVHSISKTALLFGSTWIVNAVIISAILAMILLANTAVIWFKIERVRWWYVGLFLSLAMSYLVPVHELMLGGWALRALVAGAFYSLPMFFAGVIFAVSIKKVAGVESAFAANMVGSALGGMLECSSYLFGLKAVVIIAIILYAASAVWLRKMPLMERAD